MTRSIVGALCVGALCFSCSSGSGSAGSGLRVIEFLESGQDNIPRNRILTFRFSDSVAPLQDFYERLKIRNVDRTPGSSNFTRATGVYTCDGEKVVFTPTLPNRNDRSDAGFKANGFYTVFLKAGPDALRSESGTVIQAQQEFIFDTNEFFEDPFPAEPPRALSLTAVDSSSGQTTDLSRLDPRPSDLAMIDNLTLIQQSRVIDPGGGGAPDFQAPWHIEMLVSEPLDPSAVTLDNIEMFEVYGNATTSADTDAGVDAPPGHFGDTINYKVPIKVEVAQGLNAAGVVEVRIRVIPQIVLVDDTRYRLSFSGNILGLDFRQTFIGENGVTGDGQTPVDGGTQPFPEPGGLGYTSEFIVRDRPAISAVRTVAYDPLVDGINPEIGQSALTEDKHNSALYNPLTAPGTAVGFLSGFGDGQDGDYSVSGGTTGIIDTGDTPNAFVGNPFTVPDLNWGNLHNPTSTTPTMVTYDSPQYFEMNLESLTVSAGGTLQVIGVNPMLFRVRGIVQIGGILDVAGQDGQGGATTVATGGRSGPAGGKGGNSRNGVSCRPSSSSCSSFASFLNSCAQAKSGGPFSDNGVGPGRGMAGGEAWSYGYPEVTSSGGLTGTGGGGGSHASLGNAGQDLKNAGGSSGSAGVCASSSSNGGGSAWTRGSSVIGVRGQPGPTYGDREVELVFLGGSGGAAGGTQHAYSSWGSTGAAPGGAGGGGGGSLAIFAAGAIQVPGGLIDASGGDGGKGNMRNGYTYYLTWAQASGSGGGGSGGNVVLISGNDINLTAGILDASGGAGGPAPDTLKGASAACSGCNAGGDGGKGFIFLMDADGLISGLVPSTPGEYDGYGRGVLTISGFNATRFSTIQAITELFNVGASDPAYIAMSSGDVLANVNKNQGIRVFASSANGDLDEPLLPNPTTEMGAMEIALVTHVAGSVNVEIIGDMRGLNPTGAPARDAFTRIDARFVYDDPVEAALGPFASIDQVDVSFTFNG